MFQKAQFSNPDAHASTNAPTMILYAANGAKPCFLTHAKNHATAPYATMNDTTNPIASTTQPCGSICVTPIAFSPLPRKDFSKSYAVATTIVGIDRKKENSSADALDIPAICPAAIVDIDRDVPGNTAERIWQAPIQIACPRLMSSICQVRMRVPVAPNPAVSEVEFSSSTIHITIPPISREVPMIYRLSRCLPISFVIRNAGIAVTTNATMTSPSGCVNGLRSPRLPCGKVERNCAIRLRK